MHTHRWPAVAAPAVGGVPVHERTLVAAGSGVLVQLQQVRAFPAGIEIALTISATGAAAEHARHETRSLTDPRDASASWSYLVVTVTVDGVEAEADPFHVLDPGAALHTGGPGVLYRSSPRYFDPRLPELRAGDPHPRLAADRPAYQHHHGDVGAAAVPLTVAVVGCSHRPVPAHARRRIGGTPRRPSRCDRRIRSIAPR